MKYNKLVRDKIPEIIKRKGGKAKYHLVKDDKEFFRRLLKKLEEELKEFRKDKNEEEFADIREVVEAILESIEDYYGLNRRKVKSIQKKKAKERGRFSKRIILDEA